ncbi:hypothetical protein IQ269_19185 [Tychonema sp. LEGE 07199]|uniref:hypothetical protein n=1 Tax=unclassified Tychonema TaxID=2642144 RepID=UPI001881A6F0|nr:MULTISPECIES: hypothetical protein [unclassified Tychonema]MBE9122863.1 hypothetical protein [Tychonema sp. LEGE 07199]MBE9134718.1 hypothetical protein [Tychonema sp. LEGE 07196]
MLELSVYQGLETRSACGFGGFLGRVLGAIGRSHLTDLKDKEKLTILSRCTGCARTHNQARDKTQHPTA